MFSIHDHEGDVVVSPRQARRVWPERVSFLEGEINGVKRYGWLCVNIIILHLYKISGLH
jgi:hypothetical protein